MSDQNPPTKLWELIGKLATITALAGSLIAIWVWYRTPSTDLVARVEYGVHRNNPDLLSTIQTLKEDQREKQSPDQASPAADAAESAAIAAEEAAKAAEAAIAETAFEVANRLSAIHGQGYVRTVITNEGDIPVREVVYRTPDSNVNLIVKEDKSTTVVEETPEINLASLNPNQSVEIYSWLTVPTSKYSLEDEISVHHSQGRADLVFQDDPSIVESIFYSPLVILVVLALLGLLLITFVSGFSAGEIATKKTGESETKAAV